MPLSHGRNLVLGQNTREDLPLPHGGPPSPKQTVPLEQLVHLGRMEGVDAHGGGVRDQNCKCPAGGQPCPDSLLPGVTWCTCEPRGLENPTIAVKDKTTEMEETSKSGVAEAREPAAVTRKARETTVTIPPPPATPSKPRKLQPRKP